MSSRRHLVFFNFIFLICVPAFSAHVLSCLKNFEPTVMSRQVGVETVHKSANGPITVLLPMPIAEHQYVFDLNAYAFGFQYPKQFAFSDGTLKTPFVLVDNRRESRLNTCLEELKIEIQYRVRHGLEVLEVLRTFIADYLRPAPMNWQPLGLQLPTSGLPPEFAEVAAQSPGHYPVKTKLNHPAVVLEAYLREGRGACLQKVLFTSLLMLKLNLKHQVRAGGSEESGHMWIELPDGRFLDPTWQVLEKPSAGAVAGWFSLSQTALFRNQYYPFAVDEIE